MAEYNLSQGVKVQKVGDISPLIFMLLWGIGGVGKTSFACTLPGRKLLVNFDPRGHQSVAHRDDVDVADFSGVSGRGLTDAFKSATDPLGLRKTLEDYDSVIFDSLTTVGELAVGTGIELTKGATVERPSPGAYGARNALVLALVSNALRMCNAASRHCCFIAHEGAPQTNDEGAVVSLPIYLGGQLPSQTSLRFSEVWAMYDLGATAPKKTMAIRPCRLRAPMKTRMFTTTGSPEFTLKYDPETDEGHKISDWHEEWIANGNKKIALPK